MKRKFKEDDGHNESRHTDMGISLAAYIGQYAPDILNQTEIMQGNTALTFFSGIFEPQQIHEGKRRIKSSIDWPYANRMINFSRSFLRLDDRCQRYICKAARVKIWWRGEDIQNFRLIVEETLDFRQLTCDEKLIYRKRIMAIAKTIGRHALETA